MMTITPRIRIDLHASPVEDADGVVYYDVSDPKSGNVLRLFDFEWILAQRLDGQHNFDELVRFTEAEFGFATSRGDLEVYATRLQQLGFMDPPLAAGEAPRAQVQTPVATPVQQATPPVVQPVAQTSVAPPVVQTPVVQTPVVQTPVVQTSVVTPPVAAPPVAAPPIVETRPAAPIERPTPVGPGADSDDGLMGRPVITLPAQRPQAAAKAVSGPTAAKTSGKPGTEPGKSALQEALAGLPEPEGEAVVPPKPEIKLPESVEKGASLNIAPTALLEQVAGPSTVKTGPLETVPAPSETTPVKPVTPAPSATTPVKAAEPVKTSEPVKSPEPPVVTPPIVAPTKLPETTEGGGSGKWIVIALVLFAIVGAAYYFLVYLPKAHPPAVSVQVSVAKVEDVPRLFPSAAEVKKAEPQTLKLESAGTVVSVAAENAEVTPETALVVLDVQAKLEKELADARTKIELLEKKVEVAKGKVKVDTQTKLDAQQARLGEIEASLKKAQLKTSRPGIVSKALVKAGDVVAVGADAVAVTDKALVAELKVPALEAQGLKAGMEAKLSAGPATVTAQVVRATTDGEFTTLVFSLPADATVKVGDKLSLQRGMLEKVVRAPATALVEGNKVYLIRDGKAAVQPVTVADRDGDSVILQGLSSGDSIIVNRPAELREGAAVQSAAAPAAP